MLCFLDCSATLKFLVLIMSLVLLYVHASDADSLTGSFLYVTWLLLENLKKTDQEVVVL